MCRPYYPEIDDPDLVEIMNGLEPGSMTAEQVDGCLSQVFSFARAKEAQVGAVVWLVSQKAPVSVKWVRAAVESVGELVNDEQYLHQWVDPMERKSTLLENIHFLRGVGQGCA